MVTSSLPLEALPMEGLPGYAALCDGAVLAVALHAKGSKCEVLSRTSRTGDCSAAATGSSHVSLRRLSNHVSAAPIASPLLDCGSFVSRPGSLDSANMASSFRSLADSRLVLPTQRDRVDSVSCGGGGGGGTLQPVWSVMSRSLNMPGGEMHVLANSKASTTGSLDGGGGGLACMPRQGESGSTSAGLTSFRGTGFGENVNVVEGNIAEVEPLRSVVRSSLTLVFWHGGGGTCRRETAGCLAFGTISGTASLELLGGSVGGLQHGGGGGGTTVTALAVESRVGPFTPEVTLPSQPLVPLSSTVDTRTGEDTVLLHCCSGSANLTPFLAGFARSSDALGRVLGRVICEAFGPVDHRWMDELRITGIVTGLTGIFSDTEAAFLNTDDDDGGTCTSRAFIECDLGGGWRLAAGAMTIGCCCGGTLLARASTTTCERTPSCSPPPPLPAGILRVLGFGIADGCDAPLVLTTLSSRAAKSPPVG